MKAATSEPHASKSASDTETGHEVFLIGQARSPSPSLIEGDELPTELSETLVCGEAVVEAVTAGALEVSLSASTRAVS